MLHHHTGSYYDEYRRKKSAEKKDAGKSHLEPTEHTKLLTDRSAYLSFLEVQLERVSSACLTVQGYDSRFSELEALCQQANARVGDAVKGMHQSQDIAALAEKSFAESQLAIKQRLSEMEGAAREEAERVEEVERRMNEFCPKVERMMGEGHERSIAMCSKELEGLKKEMVRHEAVVAERIVKVNSEASVNVVQQCNKLQAHLKELLAVQRSELTGLFKTSADKSATEVESTRQELSKHQYALTQLRKDVVSREDFKMSNAEMAQKMQEGQSELKEYWNEQCTGLGESLREEMMIRWQELKSQLEEQAAQMLEANQTLEARVTALDNVVASRHRELTAKLEAHAESTTVALAEQTAAATAALEAQVAASAAALEGHTMSTNSRITELETKMSEQSSLQAQEIEELRKLMQEVKRAAEASRAETAAAVDSARQGMKFSEDTLREEFALQFQKFESKMTKVRTELGEQVVEHEMELRKSQWQTDSTVDTATKILEARIQALESRYKDMNALQDDGAHHLTIEDIMKHMMPAIQEVERRMDARLSQQHTPSGVDVPAVASAVLEMLRKQSQFIERVEKMDAQALMPQQAVAQEVVASSDHSVARLHKHAEETARSQAQQLHKQAEEVARAQAQAKAAAHTAAEAQARAQEAAQAQVEAVAAARAQAEVETLSHLEARMQAEAQAHAEESAVVQAQAKAAAAAQAQAQVAALAAAQAQEIAEANARAQAEAAVAAQVQAQTEAEKRKQAEVAARVAAEARETAEAAAMTQAQAVVAAQAQAQSEVEARMQAESHAQIQQLVVGTALSAAVADADQPVPPPTRQLSKPQQVPNVQKRVTLGLPDVYLSPDPTTSSVPGGLDAEMVDSEGEDSKLLMQLQQAPATQVVTSATGTAGESEATRSQSAQSAPLPAHPLEVLSTKPWSQASPWSSMRVTIEGLVHAFGGPELLDTIQSVELEHAVREMMASSSGAMGSQEGQWSHFQIANFVWSTLESLGATCKVGCACGLVALSGTPLEERLRMMYELLCTHGPVALRASHDALLEFLQVITSTDPGHPDLSDFIESMLGGRVAIAWDEFIASTRLSQQVVVWFGKFIGSIQRELNCRVEEPLGVGQGRPSIPREVSFDTMDTNHDGVIDRDEWSRVNEVDGQNSEASVDLEMVKRVVRRIFRKNMSADAISGGSLLSQWPSNHHRDAHLPTRIKGNTPEVSGKLYEEVKDGSDEESLNELIEDVNRLVGSMGDTIQLGQDVLSMASVEKAAKVSLEHVLSKSPQAGASQSPSTGLEGFETAANQAYQEVQMEQRMSAQLEHAASSVAQLADAVTESHNRWQADVVSVDQLSQQIETCQNMIEQVAKNPPRQSAPRAPGSAQSRSSSNSSGGKKVTFSNNTASSAKQVARGKSGKSGSRSSSKQHDSKLAKLYKELATLE